MFWYNEGSLVDFCNAMIGAVQEWYRVNASLMRGTKTYMMWHYNYGGALMNLGYNCPLMIQFWF